jgi:threonyl-tRNA synthetase
MFEDQPYKLETLEELIEGKDEYGEIRSGDVISTYKHDTFEDLCLGPHLEHTGQILPDGFKLLDVSGAYWRGNEDNEMLQRVYGTVWPRKEELHRYLW